MAKTFFAVRLNQEDIDFILSFSKEGKTEALENALKILKTFKQNQPSPQPQIKIEYRDRIVEKPIYIEKVVEKIVGTPTGVEEKLVFIASDDDWLPEYFPFANMEQYKKWLNEGEA